jgi:tRNA threonylcarbamoyladenosine biosynthesis protein TsaE
MIILRTSEATATKAVAAALAKAAKSGDLIVLAGEMGVGKTAFAQGFAVGLDISDTVTSPTFTLVRSYPITPQPGRPRVLHHLDVYRLDRMNEVADLAIGELIDDRSVTLIEWGDAVADVLPKDRLDIVISYGEETDDRVIEIDATGSSWGPRLARLSATWEAWS